MEADREGAGRGGRGGCEGEGHRHCRDRCNQGQAGEGAEAARVGIAHRLAIAGAIIYATARRFGAEVITSDAHLRGLEGVRYYAR